MIQKYKKIPNQYHQLEINLYTNTFPFECNPIILYNFTDIYLCNIELNIKGQKTSDNDHVIDLKGYYCLKNINLYADTKILLTEETTSDFEKHFVVWINYKNQLMLNLCYSPIINSTFKGVINLQINNIIKNVLQYNAACIIQKKILEWLYKPKCKDNTIGPLVLKSWNNIEHIIHTYNRKNWIKTSFLN